jgi:hypothetical protein
MSEIKKILINILAITCAVLLLLILIPIIIDGASVQDTLENYIPVFVILQILTANTLVFSGLFFIRKFNCKYAVLEHLLYISCIIFSILVFGTIFDWFSGRSWILVIMAVVIYFFGLLTNIIKTRKDADELNKLLKKYKEKNDNPVT